MKNKSYLIIITCVVLSLLMSAFSLFSRNGSTPPQTGQLQAPYDVFSVDLPVSVMFCGETIALERYDMRERFDREINALSYLHSTTLLQIKRANRYFPVIEPILAKNNIPDDFKYLAVIESMLDVRAYSPAQAAGLWQFTAATAKEFGLTVADQVDERYHVEKSTEAACRYLRSAYKQFGNWTDAAASYNAGIPKIRSELEKQKVNSFFDLLLVEETSRYVFRLLAMKEIFSDPYRYGFVLKKENLYPVIRTKEIEISKDVPDFAEFAKEQGINYYQLKNFNVWLRDRSLKTMGKTYIIQIPLEEDMCVDPAKIEVHNTNWIVE